MPKPFSGQLLMLDSPGRLWEYHEVRVNALSLSQAHTDLWGSGRKMGMQPIGHYTN